MVLEVEVQPDAPATEHVLANLELPEQCVIAAVVREDYAEVPGGDDRLKAGDTAVVLANDADLEGVVQVFSDPRG